MPFAEIRKRFNGSILPSVGIYALFGVAWITLSDRILLFLIRDRILLSHIQTLKGWIFILITSVLLYFLMIRNKKSILKAQNEQESILMNVPLPLLVVMNSGRIHLVNQAFTDIYGYNSRDIPDSETWARLAYPEESYRRQVMEQWQKTLELPQEALSPSYTYTVVDKKGRDRITEFFVLKQFDSQLLICKDITAERLRTLEKGQEDKMRALGQLAGGIAHDFNNQLSAIMGFADLLRESVEEETEEYKYLLSIIEASATSAKLTGELLSYSRKSKIEMAAIDLKAILEEIVHIGERTFPSQISLTLHCNRGNGNITGCKSLLNSLFLNLLLNARDALPGGGKIEISLTRSWVESKTLNGLPLVEGHYFIVEIDDNGMGIDREVLPHIFEPFYTTKERNRGTGMGLAMVHSAMQTHRGSVEVESQKGKGTLFRLFFPENLTAAPQ